MPTLLTFDATATAALLDFEALVDSLSVAAQEHDAGQIRSPVRTALPLNEGGVLLSMPASAHDIAIHKLVSVCPRNAARDMPTIFGAVTVCDATTGQPEFILDGPTVTGRRTAALSMLGVKLLHPSAPRTFLLIGTGQEARFHAAAIGALHQGAKIFVKGRTPSSEQAFCEQMAREGVAVAALAQVSADGPIPDDIDTVIAATTSKIPVYTDGAKASRLVIGVGAFTPDAAEIAAETVRASRVFVDDFAAAKEEAGDLLQAGVDWSAVRSLGSVVGGEVRKDQPMVFKTVGSGAWDLAACRVARAAAART
ncbi:ornithine cyclodeaminase [Trinickia symbiotica]|uniref:Ornithine cyclodeaminase n=1 Tax=Trinickia symbiotica TaxID=863227 RepID=A0A2N7XB52_9BURK|nr:bifunctional Delta(1)-pyrroline-2-carboxylate/Delta(1)-piperideine-2-carboxylate reductase [Trinickia symbiotica]PMS38772.1 ornithine cyclodeaminase [Trinickia symbiotica]PPK46809.1 ornithine cyclodeaminase [Trinickia symbiotica]